MRNIKHGIFLSLILLLPINALASIAFVQAPNPTITDSSSMDVSKAFGSNVTAGSLLVACVGWYDDAGQTVTGVAGSSSGAWTAIGSKTTVASIGGNWSAQLWYKENATGGADTITATYSAAVTLGRTVSPAEFSGAATTSPLDKERGNPQENPGTTANAVTSLTRDTTADNEVVFGCGMGVQFSIGALTVGTGYTVPITPATGTFNAINIEYKLNFDIGTTAVTWTADGVTTDTIALMATFKEPAAAAGRRCRVIGGGVGGC